MYNLKLICYIIATYLITGYRFSSMVALRDSFLLYLSSLYFIVLFFLDRVDRARTKVRVGNDKVKSGFNGRHGI